jgi:hypothetical protein
MYMTKILNNINDIANYSVLTTLSLFCIDIVLFILINIL